MYASADDFLYVPLPIKGLAENCNFHDAAGSLKRFMPFLGDHRSVPSLVLF
jgi:hypothetical protein